MTPDIEEQKRVWKRVLQALRTNLNATAFTTWIAPLEFIKIEEQICTLGVKTDFTSDWVGRNYSDIIRGCFLGEGCHVEHIAFEVRAHRKKGAGGALADGEETLPAPQSAAETASPPLAADARALQEALEPRLTFENFVAGAPNELALSAARRIASNLDAAAHFNPLFIYGGVGLGKTHLLQAITSEARRRYKDANIFYLTAEQFTYRFVQSVRSGTGGAFKEMLRASDILLIDDIQFIAGKPSTQDEFIHTFNALVDRGKQIVLSASCSPFEISQMDERIKSRLQSGLAVDLKPTDYALRVGILEQRKPYHQSFFPNAKIDTPVFEFLAKNICTNIRTLEGALTQLYALGNLLGKPVTLQIAKERLAQNLRATERRASLDNIIQNVAEHYNISVADMLSPNRGRAVSRPRQIAMYLAKKLTNRSYPEIGRRFGGRDHTTVLHAVRKVAELCNESERFSQDVDLLSQRLNG